MIKGEIAGLLLDQAGMESNASAAYLSLAMWCNENGYFGCQSLFEKSSKEEMEHRDKILEYLSDFAEVGYREVPAMKAQVWRDYSSLLEVFKAVYNLEVTITKSVHALYSRVMSAEDWHTVSFLTWFLDEQRDAVATSADWVAKCQAAQDCLLVFDEQMGA